MHLYLIRHGQSYVNLETWTGGNTDEGLTDLGQHQAEALAAWLPQHLPQIDGLYASTMRRARETVLPLATAYGVEVSWDDRLREVGNNRLDHSPWPHDELPRDYATYWSSERPFATLTPTVNGGETFMHFRTRVGLFIEDLVNCCRGKTIVAVCHGGVVEAVFDHTFNIGPWRRCEIWCHNTGVSHFEFVELPRRETWRLHSHDRIEHLTGVA